MDLTVMFADRPTPADQGVGFDVPFSWDIDLLAGYEHRWLVNRAPLPHRGRYADYDAPEVVDLIRAGEFDAVLVHGWHARMYWQAMRACWATGTPVYVRGDSQLANDAGRLKRGIKRVLYPWFMRRYAACLSVGQRSEAYFRFYGARRVVRSPHFVDNDRFAADAALAGKAARQEWGIGQSETVALFAGKLQTLKRVPDLIAAAGKIGTGGVVVLIVGEGNDRRRCEAAAATAGARVIFAGFLNQRAMARAYAAADVLVLPSDRETWGLVVNEAMACGKPAFVSDAAGCVPDLIVPGETGDRFAPGDVERLAFLLRHATREKLAVMGNAALRQVAGFTAQSAADGVLEALDGSPS
jgi:glycosyltransferase involved in cell wall biosynthesis